MESAGHQRTVGRFLGYLILAEEPKNLDDIAADLLVSKATASLTIRRGILMGMVEKTSLPGNRKTFFQVDARSWVDTYSQMTRNLIADWEVLLDKGLRAVRPESRRAVDNLTAMRDFMRFFLGRFAGILEEYRQKLAEDAAQGGRAPDT